MKYARYILITILAVSFCAAETPNEGMNSVKWEKTKHAYITLLSHENPGVKASAANFVRKYNIVEAREELIKVLECNTCEVAKISAGLALIQVAGAEGLKIIKKVMKTEENELVVAFYQSVINKEPNQYIAPLTKN